MVGAGIFYLLVALFNSRLTLDIQIVMLFFMTSGIPLFHKRSVHTEHRLYNGCGKVFIVCGRNLRKTECACIHDRLHIGLERYAALLSQEDWNEIEQNDPNTINVILSFVSAQEAIDQSQAERTGRCVLGNSNGGLYLEDVAKQARKT